MPSTANAASSLLSPELMSRLEQLELVSRQVFRGRMKGERRSKRKGESVEFADFRNYVPGDDLRLIDWNLYARLDQLFLKLFLEEEDLHFYTLIDNSDSMTFGDPSKLHVAKQIAAAMGYIGLCRADRVKLQALGQSGASAPAMRGKSNLWKMLDYLDDVPAGENQSLQTGVREFVLRNQGNGIVVLITDLMDKEGYDAALRMLLGRRMDIYVLHLLSPEELEPDVSGDIRLVDIEDGDMAEITANRYVLEKYRETVAKFIETAKQFCARRNITYMLARSDTAIDKIVTQYLMKRGVVR